jgi:3-hydroxyisobutyrate dehydrogenase-like beta-hydroxyacid dehydrogenase
MTNSAAEPLGFIGLGVMGAPMCRNLAQRAGRVVRSYDRVTTVADVPAMASVAALTQCSAIIFLCLPSGAHVETVAAEILAAADRQVRMIVDMGTSPVAMTRAMAARMAAEGIAWVDAPIARTRQAAEDGTLSVMVGATEADFAILLPLLTCMASDVTLCGPVGCGQAVKILNNMVLVETVSALSEALAIGRGVGLDPAVLFDTLAKGSADSFALRNHGRKAMLPGVFPERAFSVAYARKDIGYALELARDAKVDAAGAERGAALLDAATDAGWGDLYWPVMARLFAA